MTAVAQAESNLPFKVEAVTSFDVAAHPVFLPDGGMLLMQMQYLYTSVTQKGERNPEESQACPTWISAARGGWATLPCTRNSPRTASST